MIYKSAPYQLSISQICSITWLLSTAFTYINLPWNIPSVIQLPEIIFLFWALADYKAFLNKEKILAFVRLAWPIILFGLYMTVKNYIQIREFDALYDSITLFYLLSVAFLVTSNNNLLFSKNPKMWLYTLFILVILNCIPALTGFVLSQLNIPNTLAFGKTSLYPIVGQFSRPLGFHYTPTMLFDNLALPFMGLLFFQKPSKKTLKVAGLIITSVVIILSLNKHIFTLGISILAILSLTHQLSISKAILLSCSLFCFQQFNIYFTTTYSPENPNIQQQLGGVPDCVGSPIFTVGKWDLYPTYYYAMRSNQIPLLKDNWLLGIGSGQYLKTQESYNQNATAPPCLKTVVSDPHSMWLGTLLENGIIGFLLLSTFMFQSVKRAKLQIEEHELKKVILGMVLFIFIAGFVTDILNFRPFWFVIGLLYVQIKAPPSSKDPVL